MNSRLKQVTAPPSGSTTGFTADSRVAMASSTTVQNRRLPRQPIERGEGGSSGAYQWFPWAPS